MKSSIQNSIAKVISIRKLVIKPTDIGFEGASIVLAVIRRMMMRALALVQVIILSVVIKWWNIKRPSGRIRQTCGTPDAH
jgi:hypothetical protein